MPKYVPKEVSKALQHSRIQCKREIDPKYKPKADKESELYTKNATSIYEDGGYVQARNVTEKTKQKMFLKPQEYQLINTGATVDTPPTMNGPMLLKHIIAKSHIDTNATINTIRLQLLNLPKKMETMRSNIQEFNMYVEQQIIALTARGQVTKDLLVNLF